MLISPALGRRQFEDKDNGRLNLLKGPTDWKIVSKRLLNDGFFLLPSSGRMEKYWDYLAFLFSPFRINNAKAAQTKRTTIPISF